MLRELATQPHCCNFGNKICLNLTNYMHSENFDPTIWADPENSVMGSSDNVFQVINIFHRKL